LSGNDDSPHSLKAELADLVGDTSVPALAQLVRDGRINPAQIDMLSFNQFKQSFDQALQHAVIDEHGKSYWKVFKEESGGLSWIADAANRSLLHCVGNKNTGQTLMDPHKPLSHINHLAY